MRPLKRNFIAGLIVLAMTLAVQSDANAQYAVAVQPVVPAVVGYTAQRRGLFGQRVVMRPIVAPVAAAAVPVVAARPVVAEPVAVQYAPPAAPVAAYYAPPAAPVAAYYAPPAPVTMQYAPLVAPVATYYRAPVPVVPVRSYRVAVPYLYGF